MEIRIFAFLRKTPNFGFPVGDYNGYVGFLDPDNKINADDINVHGGITFDSDDVDLSFFPVIPLTSIPPFTRFHKYRIIGFDTCHHGDENMTFDDIVKETFGMMEQVKEMLKIE